MCSGLAKCILVIVNLIFLLAGLLMLAFGILAKVKPDMLLTVLGNIPGMSKIPSAFDLNGIITAGAIFMIILGAVVAAVGFFGCCGACCNSKPLLIIYIVILVVVLLAEAALIIFAAVAPDVLKDNIQTMMEKSRKDFKEDLTLFDNDTLKVPNNPISLGWTFLQIGASCCGTYNSSDYINGGWRHNFTYKGMAISAVVPISCCNKTKGIDLEKSSGYDSATFSNLNECLNGNSAYINQKNCYDSIFDLIQKSLYIAIGIAAGIIAVELLLILLAACLCCKAGDKSNKPH